MRGKIGHASVDERGKASGGAAGDQTGKEVCVRGWYSGGWHTVLRPKRAELAEKSARACEAACANPNIGYDQSGRNSLYAAAKEAGFDLSKIGKPCECDCSSLMHVCIIAGGARMAYGSNGTTTSIMVREIMNTGDFEKLTDSKYLTTDKYLRRGDILVKKGHTAMVLENGAYAGASAAGSATAAAPTTTYAMNLPLLQRGSEGEPVRALQVLLIGYGYSCGAWGADGEFGSATEKALLDCQAAAGLPMTGKTNLDTWCALLGQPVEGVG